LLKYKDLYFGVPIPHTTAFTKIRGKKSASSSFVALDEPRLSGGSSLLPILDKLDYVLLH
jgi:hypothetical protein